MAIKQTAPSSLANIGSTVANVASQVQKGGMTQAQISNALSALEGAKSQLESGVKSGAYKSGVDYAELDRPVEIARATTQPVVPSEAITTPTQNIPVFKDTGVMDAQAILNSLNLAQQTGAQAIEQRAAQESNLFKQMQDIVGTPPSTAEAYKQAQRETAILEKQQKVSDLSSQLNQITAQAQAQQLAVTGQGRGIPEAIIGGQQAQIAKEAAIQALPISASLQAAQGNLEMAQQNLNTLFQIKSQDATNQYNYKKSLVEGLYNLADKQEQRKLDYAMKLEDRKYKEEQDNINTIQELAINAAKNGAGATTLSKISNSKTISDAILSSSGYMNDPYERRLKLAQITKLEAEAEEAANAKKISNMLKNLDPSSPSFTLEMMKGSKGGKTLTEGQLTPINKGLTVVNQIGTLTQLLDGANTGPITGILRSNNPYDVKAQQIDAQLRALVPNLARGVYGEVGVLTDTDISNYSKTLGNIRSTEQANKLLLSMTLKTIKNSLDNQFEVNAAAGRDVSGFEPIYNRLQNQLNTINSSLGISTISNTANSYIDTQLDSIQKKTNPKTDVGTSAMNWLSNYYNPIKK